MKRMAGLMLGVVLLLGICSLARADQAKNETAGCGCGMACCAAADGPGMKTDGKKDGWKEEKEGMRGMGMNRMPMQPMMPMQESMVASSDGGVIVLIGNRLLKYDRNLELKKEVELKPGMEGMRKMMPGEMEKHRMMKKGEMKDGAKAETK